MQVTLQYAAQHLADLALAVRRGEEVEIAEPEQPAIKLVVAPDVPLKPLLGPDGKRILGAGCGEMVVPTEEEWQAMDRELASLINDSPLIPLGYE